MQYFGTRSVLVAGVIALAIGIGAGVIFASRQAGAAFARGGETEFAGVVEALPTTGTVGTWQVSGRTVIVTERTEIDREGQTLTPGLRVEIEGYTQSDGTIVAEEIEVQKAGDDGGPVASSVPGAPARKGDDDDGGPSAAHGDDDHGGPAVPNAVPAARDDDD